MGSQAIVAAECGLKFTRTLITPEIAKKMLEWNHPDNRGIITSSVKRFSASLLNGTWCEAGVSTIVFDRDGFLIDGQHRLTAIVETGVSMWFLVVEGADPKARTTIDIGRPRDASDVLTLSGEVGQVHPTQVAVLRWMVCGLNRSRRLPDGDALVALYAQFRTSIEFSFDALPRTTRIPKLTTGPVRAVVARAYHSQDHADLRQFGQLLLTGVGITPETSAVLRLRDRLLSGIGSDVTIRASDYALTANALSYYLRRKSLKKLYPATQEPFPVPALDGQPQVGA